MHEFQSLGEQRRTIQEYKAWFAYHFLDGLANASTRLDRQRSSVVLVGPPRVRQGRYANCSVDNEMARLVACVDRHTESVLPFGRRAASGLPYMHRSAEETGDKGHTGDMRPTGGPARRLGCCRLPACLPVF